jgi:GNAT superfamily N-acetyltransferase
MSGVPRLEKSQPRTLTAASFTDAAVALSRAFHDDPMSIYMVADAATRADVLPLHMTVALRMGQLFGEVYVSGDPPVGAAVWFPPHLWELTAAQLAEAGAQELERALPAGAFARFMAIEQFGEQLHRRDAAFPHWYLAVLGVEPAMQGRGLGGALMRPVLEKADRQGLPCYLETAVEENVPFYRSHGFDVVVDGEVPGTALRFWTMLRGPRN